MKSSELVTSSWWLPACRRQRQAVGMAVLIGVILGQPQGYLLAQSRSEKAVRATLTADQLLDGMALDGPRDADALARPAGAAPALHTFEGRLTLSDQVSRGRYQLLRGTSAVAQRRLPAFDHAFVQRGSHLIPVERGLIVTGDAAWQLILEPGRVWHEPTDQGYSRASLPFAVVEVNQMCTHNGVLTFLFDTTSVSHVWYQITQETCALRQANFWGMLRAHYQPASIPGAAGVRGDHAREVVEWVTRAPLGRLAIDFPGLDLARVGRGITAQHMTSYGVVYRGTSYLAPCRTRFGDDPYCRALRTPSYSTAKSSLAAVALMRLAEKYGAGVLQETIGAWVPQASAGPGAWDDVTFLDALDMATGHYHSSAPFDDEDRRLGAFFVARTRARKLNAAFDAPRRQAPGTTWVYRSSDHFILTQAMQSFVRDREGSNADIFDFVVREVYQPLGIGPGFHSVLRTSDGGWRGTPFGFSGLFFTPDDIAKLTVFLNVDRGRIGGRQVLHRPTLDAALQRDPARRGLATGVAGRVYQHGFFGQRIAPPGGSAFWTPYMSGFGGIVFALLPNGATYHFTSDNNEFAFREAAIELMRRLPAGSGGGGSGGDGGGGGDGCTVPVGHPRYCTDCGPCASGEGDCDRDSDCAAGLTCVDNVGATYGFLPGIDVCQPSADGGGPGCALPAGHPQYCDACGPCASGEGDCDRDSDCAAGLTCVDNVGATYGFAPGIDVCQSSTDGGGSGCALPAGHPQYCDSCGPCGSGEGDCDRDSDCAAGLSCVDNIGADFGFHPGIDVCQ